MQIGGFLKLTLLDYPHKVAATVFCAGCQLRCPFCHNPELVFPPFSDLIPEEEVLAYLEKRRGLLDGVCITGGEPLLQPDLPIFMQKLKRMDYAVKLDTNGMMPQKLKTVVQEGLVDYVAMDVKQDPQHYAEICGLPDLDIDLIDESIAFLLENTVDYEFRTTVVADFHQKENILGILKWIEGAENYYLQKFVPRENLVGSKNFQAPADDFLKEMQKLALEYVNDANLRGLA